MASARCYTKSGSVEKYESGCFSGVINHYPNNFNSNMTEPDYNGNYSITYNGYDDGDSSNYDCYCETIYGDWRNGGGIKKTFYFKKTQQLHQYSLQLAVNIAFDPRIYGDCGAFLSTMDFTPMATDNPNRFHLLNVESDGSGEVQYVEISMMDSASEPKIEDFSIRVTSGYNKTTTVYGRNFKLYTYGKYKDSGSSPRWNYLGEESEYHLLNVVKLS